MPSAMPAELAEKLSDPPYDAEAEDKLCERALEDLVDRLMNGEQYPRQCAAGRMGQINRLDILANTEQLTLAQILEQALRDSLSNWEKEVKTIVRHYLRDSPWHGMRVAEMREEQSDD